MRKLLILGFAIVLFSCSKKNDAELGMNKIAEEYKKLVLDLGQYDKNYVDAYYGPESWKVNNKEDQFPLSRFRKTQKTIISKLYSLDTIGMLPVLHLRYKSLQKQINSVGVRVEIVHGKEFSFDEESLGLYDALAPRFSESYFNLVINKLNEILPGKGSVEERMIAFKKQFIIPDNKLDEVFMAAINEARKRTLKHFTLPTNESFKVEYVKNKVWGAYNWYKGDAFSVIQVNTDNPIAISRAVDLACHEGYPGHHVYNTLLETNLYKNNGWVEYCVYPLYSPQSFIAEGTANYGINVCFPLEERIKFEKEVLFPLAGLDASKVELYYEVLRLSHKLSYARNEAARMFFDEKIDKQTVIKWLAKYSLRSIASTSNSFEFIKANKSYIINYNYGQDMVGLYMKKHKANGSDVSKTWSVFEELLSTPQVGSNLR